MPRKLFRKKHKKLLLKAFAIGILVMILTIIFVAERKFSHLVLGGLGESFSTKVYTSPTVLKLGIKNDGFPWTVEAINDKLNWLNYRKISSPPNKPGEYFRDGQKIEIFLNGFDSPFIKQQPMYVRIEDEISKWWLSDGANNELEEVALEPALLDELSGPKKIRREPASWEEIPVRLADSVVAAEDSNFYSHWGLSFKSMLRAFMHNISGGNIQGGSTITQQLAKNFFLSPQRSFRRKITEALFALYLEARFSKEKILTLYLNHIYMGQDGTTSVAGMKSAAFFYFGKNLNDLNLSECALLAGIIRSPHRYNPYRDMSAARDRREYVLNRLSMLGLITKKEAAEAERMPIVLRSQQKEIFDSSGNYYYMAEVIRQLIPRYGESGLYRYGLKIYTALDPFLQNAASEAIKKANPQGAIVVLDPQSGAVRALSGGTSFQQSQFNRATQAKRQPGSAFKPFVFGAALEKGLTTSTLLKDEKKSYSDGHGGRWHPKNFKNVYHGIVPLRDALTHSLNGATLDLINKIGTACVIQFARNLGIESPLDKSLALGLGSSEVTLLELTSAYAAFDNGGFRVKPYLVTAIQDANGDTIEIHAPDRTSVISPALASLMTSLLQTIVQEGTAKALPLMGWNEPCAGKTGTTNDGRDAWFIGFTSELLAGVWVGADQGITISVVGATHALPVWAKFMELAYRNTHPAKFEIDKALIEANIDPTSGGLAVSGCPVRRKEFFLAGTEPKTVCRLHSGGVKGWFDKLFRKK